MPELVGKTGVFHLRLEMRRGVSDDERGYRWKCLLDNMTRHVAVVSDDGRAYELCVEISEWELFDSVQRHAVVVSDDDRAAEIDEWGLLDRMQYREVKFTLVLVDPLQAEVGEHVKGLFVRVPDDIESVRLPTGEVFDRVHYGWQRVE